MDLKKIGKYIAYLLRHHPEDIDMQLDRNGWANTKELIDGVARRYTDFNMAFLDEVVRTDNKHRYSFNEDKTRIRANQGHSIDVDVELKEAIPPPVLWHGTGEKYVASIDKKGLIPKGRLYVHLSKDTETAAAVGKRHGKPIIYRVLSAKMADDGYKFYLSENGVWLTKEVPIKYLIKEARNA